MPLTKANKSMKGGELIRRVRRWGREKGVAVRFAKHRGKGRHGMLYVGTRMTMVKDRKKELGPGLLAKMLRDLGIGPDEFR